MSREGMAMQSENSSMSRPPASPPTKPPTSATSATPTSSRRDALKRSVKEWGDLAQKAFEKKKA